MATVISRVSVSRTTNSKVYKQNQAESGFYTRNPLDLDSKLEPKRRSTRVPSAPAINPLHDARPRSSYSGNSELTFGRKCYKNEFHESGGSRIQPEQELEDYAVQKAEETTRKIHDCLKVAEETREVGSRTLVNMHQQDEQIIRTHLTAASIDQGLSRGEKLLGSLGGLFSKTWKPKKAREIKGPVLTRDYSFRRRGSHMEQRRRFGLTPPDSQSNPRRSCSEPSSAVKRTDLEKEKQDDALSVLSNLLGELKVMAIDMGSEIDRQNKALDDMQDDVDELNFRVREANIRTRYLLRR